MFQWAQSTLDKLAQHVAPPPDDGPSRYAYCLQRGDEDAAMGCLAAMDPVHTVVNQVKGQYPIHLACQYSFPRLLQLLLNQPGMNIQQIDLAGNTPLHYASMSTASNGLDVVKLLITSYGASVVARNAQGQTPYDVATLNVIRQYLLPIQLQAETQIALDNGGQGLPPGIDLGGLKIKNPTMAPPPTFAGPPGSNMMTTTTTTAQSPNLSNATTTTSPSQTTQVTPAPSSREYSRVGSSSAALGGKYRADGFHSSSSDVSLQKKYGHANVGTYSKIAPPPSSGNSVGASPASAGAGGPNPFAAGGRYTNRRYVAYGQVATPTTTSAYSFPASTMSAPSSFGAPAASPTGTFGGSGQMVSFVPSSATSTTPASYGAPMTTPYMPPPPYQTQPNMGTTTANTLYSQNPTDFAQPQYSRPSETLAFETTAPTSAQWSSPSQPSDTMATLAVQNSANLAEASAQDVFTAPSPQKEAAPSLTSTTTMEPQPEMTTHANPESHQAAAIDGTYVSSSSSSSHLPEHWVEAVDPSSGQTYYYNSVTHETSWEIPVALPENWVEATDPTSGQIYYYNHVTQETSWDKPTATPAAPVSSPEQATAPAAASESEAATMLSASATFDSSAPTGTEQPTTIVDNQTWNAAAAPLSSGADPLATEAVFTSTASETFASPPLPASSPTKDATAMNTFGSPADTFNSAAPSSSVAEPTVTTNTVMSPAEAFGSAAPSPLVGDTSASTAFDFPAPPSAMAGTSAIPLSSDVVVPESAQVSDAIPSIPNSSSLRASPPPMSSSLFVAPPRRKMSADELFAEDAPEDDDNDNTANETTIETNVIQSTSPPPAAAAAAFSTPQKPTPDSTVTDELDGDGTLDDIPLSPDFQRPVATEATPVAFPTTTTAATTTIDNSAESLFAAIGMPPPPFSARKR